MTSHEEKCGLLSRPLPPEDRTTVTQEEQEEAIKYSSKLLNGAELLNSQQTAGTKRETQ